MSLYTFCVSWTLMPKDTDPGVPEYSSLLFLGAEPPAHVIGPPAGTLLHYACKCNVGQSTFFSMLCFDRPRHSCQAALYHGSDMLNLKGCIVPVTPGITAITAQVMSNVPCTSVQNICGTTPWHCVANVCSQPAVAEHTGTVSPSHMAIVSNADCKTTYIYT